MQTLIQFLGATNTVTGSRTLISHNKKNVLIDCGLFQGPKFIKERNWEVFPNADKIDAVILTHAHIDHSGYLPKIVSEGFNGPIFCSQATFDLCKIMLLDSAHLQEEDAKYANKTKHSRHNPAIPLYTIEDAKEALKLFKPIEMDIWIEIYSGISLKLLRSGHILGSSFVQLSLNHQQKSKIITFSGDLGNNRQNVIKGPINILETDFLVMEGTYGNRIQPKTDPSEVLKEIINKVYNRNGVLVIPSFAVGRTQELLYLIRKLEVNGLIPPIPVHLDSPMAIEATNIYLQHNDLLKPQFLENKISQPLCPSCYSTTKSTDDSMLLCMKDGPMIVISAAGMLTGGRVLHHLKARLPHANNAVLFVGWQAEETKGRLLQQGLPKIRIHHQEIDVEAEIVAIDSLSAHGDSDDIINWINQIHKKPQNIFLNHGEEDALLTLKKRIDKELQLNTYIPTHGETIEL